MLLCIMSKKTLTIYTWLLFLVVSLTDGKTFGKKSRKLKDPGEFDPRYILTEQDENKFLDGVVPNLKANETLDHDEPSEKLISVPGCPLSVPKLGFGNHPSYRDPWLYFGDPPKCYLSGTPGPCPSGMNFYAQSGSQFGRCSCDCFGTISPFVYDNPSSCYKEEDAKHYTVYAGNGLCYPLMSQGPCEFGEILMLDEDNIATCEKSKCLTENEPSNETLSSSDSTPFLDISTDSCKQLGSPCEDQPNHVYAITRYNWFPKCVPREETQSKLSIVLPVPPTPLRCHNEGQLFSPKLRRCVLLS